MDQLVALQEIYESFSKGGDKLRNIDPKSIKGTCPKLVGELLEAWLQGGIDEEILLQLLDCLQDVFEIKRLGDICRKAGHFGPAIRSYNRALSLCSDAAVQPVLHNNLGQAYALQGDQARAVLYFQKAASGFECAGDGGGQAHVLGNLGSAYRKAGDWDRAIEYTYRSLKTFEESGDDLGTAQMEGSLGRIYADMGERDLAERYFERSLKDFQRLGDKRSAAWILNRLGGISSERRDWDEALKSYNQSLSLFEDLGNKPGAAIALLSMGRMHLAMDQTAAARESLERALPLVPKGSRPAYQNTLSSLAATYSALGRDYLREAEESGAGDERTRALQAQAAQAFARASDRYLELDSALKGKVPDIRAAAAIAKSRSYLAKLSASISDQERLALTERAAAALDEAHANSEGQRRLRIEGLQRTLEGMKDALSISQLRSEPWKLTGAVAGATENLSSGLGSGEANACLGEALRSLGSSIEAERDRREPAEHLKAAALSLRRAQEQFSIMGTALSKQSALKMNRAAQLLEKTADPKAAPPMARSRSSLADQLNYGQQREALLLIARASAENTLAELDDAASYVWDESLNLVQKPSAVEEKVTDTFADAALETCHPVLRISLERDEVPEEIPAEIGTEARAAESSVSAGGMLVPVRSNLARTPGPQIFMHRDLPFSQEPEIVSARREQVTETNPAQQVIEAAKEEASEPGDDKETTASAATDPVISEFFRGPQPAAGTREGLISRANGIIMVKAMTLVVVLLLAIDTVLHLI